MSQPFPNSCVQLHNPCSKDSDCCPNPPNLFCVPPVQGHVPVCDHKHTIRIPKKYQKPSPEYNCVFLTGIKNLTPKTLFSLSFDTLVVMNFLSDKNGEVDFSKLTCGNQLPGFPITAEYDTVSISNVNGFKNYPVLSYKSGTFPNGGPPFKFSFLSKYENAAKCKCNTFSIEDGRIGILNLAGAVKDCVEDYVGVC